jgi:hypothetical protein
MNCVAPERPHVPQESEQSLPRPGWCSLLYEVQPEKSLFNKYMTSPVPYGLACTACNLTGLTDPQFPVERSYHGSRVSKPPEPLRRKIYTGIDTKQVRLLVRVQPRRATAAAFQISIERFFLNDFLKHLFQL